MTCKDGAAGTDFQLAPFNYTGGYNAASLRTQVANVYIFGHPRIFTGGIQSIGYKITSGMDNAMLVVTGWSMPTYGYGA
jgi:hypothetical protein